MHSNKDETYRQGCHELTGMSQLAEQVVRYDLDDLDVCWLQRVNEEREEIGNYWTEFSFFCLTIGLDYEIFSTVILSLQLIQEGQLSVW